MKMWVKDLIGFLSDSAVEVTVNIQTNGQNVDLIVEKGHLVGLAGCLPQNLNTALSAEHACIWINTHRPAPVNASLRIPLSKLLSSSKTDFEDIGIKEADHKTDSLSPQGLLKPKVIHPLRIDPNRRTALWVGRDRDCDLFLNHPSISRRHCLVSMKEGRACIRDHGSTNGCFVNGVAVDHCWLHEGDLIQIGNVMLLTQYSSETAKSESYAKN